MVQAGPSHRSGPGGSGPGGSGRGGSGPGPGSRGARPTGRRPSSPTTTFGLVREAVIVLVVALVLASLLRAFVVQAFVIPSGSMENTLECNRYADSSCDADVSDRVVVSKLSVPVGGIHRGDVVVFSDPGGWLNEGGTAGGDSIVRRGLEFVGVVPNDTTGHLIKRVVAVGGDNVRTDPQGRVLVNGFPLEEPYLKPGTPESSICSFDVTVPADSLWVMGDNRGNSLDSRYHQTLAGGGAVPMNLVTGRAVARVWPVGRIGWLGVPATFAHVPAPSAATADAPFRRGSLKACPEMDE